MKELIIKLLANYLSKEESEIEDLIEIPPNSEMGDFAFPCFSLDDKKTGAPYVGVFFAMIGAIAMIFVGDIGTIAKATTFMIFVAFLAVNLALIALRFNPHYPRPAFKVPWNIGGFPITAVIGAAICFFMLLGYSFFELGVTIVFVLIWLGLFLLGKEFGKKPGAAKRKKWATE